MSTKDGNLYTKEDLNGLGIYELREIGRSIGVPSPTTLKKEQLVDYILGIIYGEEIKKTSGKLRGRPARNKQKANNLFIDLIDKVESPKCDKNFIERGGYNTSSFSYPSLISSKVASTSSPYINSAKKNEPFSLKSGTVCYEEDKIVVRALRFIVSANDPSITKNLIEDYNLRDNDIIEYLLDNEGKNVAQIIKINGEVATRLDKKVVVNLREQSEQIDIQGGNYVKTNASNIVYAPTQADRADLIDKSSKVFQNLDYSVIKVCFDRNSPVVRPSNNSKNVELYTQSIGDEYETMAIAELAIEKAKLFNILGFKTAVLIDNLSWLMSVVKTYPQEIYGNFIQKLAKITKGISTNITLVCFSSYLSNETINLLKESFDNIVTN